MTAAAFPEVKSICDEFGITIIPGNRYPAFKETRCAPTLDRIRRNHGEGHLRIVLSTLIETGPNGALLDEFTLWAVSDLVIACADWIEADASSWFEAWDKIPVGQIFWALRDIRSAGRMRAVRFGALYLALQNFRNGMNLDTVIRNEFDRRLFAVMNKEGTERGFVRQTSEALGRTILAAERIIPPQDFGKWLEGECKIPVRDARRYAKIASKPASNLDKQAA